MFFLSNLWLSGCNRSQNRPFFNILLRKLHFINKILIKKCILFLIDFFDHKWSKNGLNIEKYFLQIIIEILNFSKNMGFHRGSLGKMGYLFRRKRAISHRDSLVISIFYDVKNEKTTLFWNLCFSESARTTDFFQNKVEK